MSSRNRVSVLGEFIHVVLQIKLAQQIFTCYDAKYVDSTWIRRLLCFQRTDGFVERRQMWDSTYTYSSDTTWNIWLIFRFIDFLEEETFRLRYRIIARKERGEENTGEEHFPLEEQPALSRWIPWPWWELLGSGEGMSYFIMGQSEKRGKESDRQPNQFFCKFGQKGEI